MVGASLKVMQLRLELAKDRIEQVIRIQLSPVPNCLDRFNTDSGTVHVCNRHGAIEGDDRRIIQLRPLIIERQNPWPIRGLIVVSRAMAGGDAGLKMVLADLVSGGCLAQVKYTVLDHSSVPIRTVLLSQAKDVSLRVDSLGQPRCVQKRKRH